MSEYNPSFLKEKEKYVAERAIKMPNLTCFIDQFPLAMVAIANVHDYARGPLVKGDYRPSLLRHLFKIGEDAAVAWNAIAQLEIKLRQAPPALAPRVWSEIVTMAPREWWVR